MKGSTAVERGWFKAMGNKLEEGEVYVDVQFHSGSTSLGHSWRSVNFSWREERWIWLRMMISSMWTRTKNSSLHWCSIAIEGADRANLTQQQPQQFHRLVQFFLWKKCKEISIEFREGMIDQRRGKFFQINQTVTSVHPWYVPSDQSPVPITSHTHLKFFISDTHEMTVFLLICVFVEKIDRYTCPSQIDHRPPSS